MTPVQEEKIHKLKLQGLGCKAIAREMDMTVNAIKSYCKRHRISGSAEVVKVDIEEKSSLCLYCKNPILPNKRGRTKKFCSDACRYTWWNENQDKRSKSSTAIYHYSCQHCGRSFISYGDKQRKYCSLNCYFKARFWQEELQAANGGSP